MDGTLFADYVARNPIDVLKIVPSHLAALFSSGGGRDVLPRRSLILGGEVLTWELIERIRGLGGSCEIVNHYGPTEATVGSLIFRVDPGEGRGSSMAVPIGRPIANTEVYILDAAAEPVARRSPRGALHRRSRTGRGLLQPTGGDGRKIRLAPVLRRLTTLASIARGIAPAICRTATSSSSAGWTTR